MAPLLSGTWRSKEGVGLVTLHHVHISISDTPMGELEGHTHRIPRLAFHPSGRFLAAAS